jgi:hypothetical protein
MKDLIIRLMQEENPYRQQDIGRALALLLERGQHVPMQTLQDKIDPVCDPKLFKGARETHVLMHDIASHCEAEPRLRSCPFCKSDDLFIALSERLQMYTANCRGCGASGPQNAFRDEAMLIWNTRPPM